MDDVDLERIPRFTMLDPSTAMQQTDLQAQKQCANGMFNCTFDARHLDGIGQRGATFLGAHVPTSICTPSRYAILTGRLASSSPMYSRERDGRLGQRDAIDIFWDSYLEASGMRTNTLGSMLQNAGYYTGFVGKYHLTSASSELHSYARGEHGVFVVDADFSTSAQARNQALFDGLTRAREPLQESIRRSGFNYTGAVELGNVGETSQLGLGVHNAEWEAEAATVFLREANERIGAGAAEAFYLHMCTTLTHSPGPQSGICANGHLCEAGLLSRLPSTKMASRPEIFARAGGKRCGWAEFDSVHTIWMDEQVGAVLSQLRELGVERDTLFIALADHQRLGKGGLYHGTRTPMLLQWPARVSPGQVLPRDVLVSSLDIVPTALDAARVLPLSRAEFPRNAGSTINGRSLLPLLATTDSGKLSSVVHGGVGAPTAAINAGNVADDAAELEWRDSIWLEVGFGAAVKHSSGWQLTVNVLPDDANVPTPQSDGSTRSEKVADAIVLERTRLDLPEGGFTHTIDSRWRNGGGPIELTIFGEVESHSRFENAEMYPHFHDAEALVHTLIDPSMSTSFRWQCPRQLSCLQLLLRHHAIGRTHFNGAIVPFGIYTADSATWRHFNSGECDLRSLTLPPDSCNAAIEPHATGSVKPIVGFLYSPPPAPSHASPDLLTIVRPPPLPPFSPLPWHGGPSAAVGTRFNAVALAIAAEAVVGILLLLATVCLAYYFACRARIGLLESVRPRKRYVQMEGPHGVPVIVECTGSNVLTAGTQAAA